VARRWTGDRPYALRVAIAVGFAMLAIGIAVAASLVSFWVVLTGLFLRGIGGGIVWVFSSQLLMQVVPDAIRGRIFATEFALFTLMGAVSAALSGWAIDLPTIGIAGTLWWMVVLCLMPALGWTLYVLRGKSRLSSRSI
jgi:MFS family permease